MIKNTKKFGLPKDEILKGKNNFNRIFKFGTIISGYNVSLTFLKSDVRKVGFVVTKKIKRAVVRNRYKRLLREVYRINKAKFPEKAYIILFAKGKSDNFGVIQNEVLKLLNMINCIYYAIKTIFLYIDFF